MISSLTSIKYPHKILSAGLIALLLLMFISISTAMIEAHFWAEVKTITAMQWGKVTIIDLYIGLLLISCWVFWRENSPAKGLLWSVLILLLGNVVTCVYLLIALYECSAEPAHIIQRKRR